MAEKENPDVRKAWARKLFLETQMTQQEIAELTQTEPSQLSRWKTNGKWEELKDAQSINPAVISREIQNALGFMLANIKENGKPITLDETKQVVSLVECIQKLKAEPTLGEASTILGEVVDFIRENYPDILEEFITAQNDYLSKKALENKK